MGWGNCGVDTRGRSIGYIFAGTCDHPDCLKAIDRGLSYACGDMHGEDEYSCEKYFCEEHRCESIKTSDGTYKPVCEACYKEYNEYYATEIAWDDAINFLKSKGGVCDWDDPDLTGEMSSSFLELCLLGKGIKSFEETETWMLMEEL